MSFTFQHATTGYDWTLYKLGLGEYDEEPESVAIPSGTIAVEPVSSSPDAPDRNSCKTVDKKKKQYSTGYYIGLTIVVLLFVLLQVMLIKLTWNFTVPKLIPSVRPASFIQALVLKLLIDVLLL